MATTFATFRPAPITASSVKPEPNKRKPVSAKWWTPLFGWSSDPDYVNPVIDSTIQNPNTHENSGSDSDPGRSRSRFTLGCFTEEKAKQLRKKTLESSTFHDIMYHSAIASRLASDLSDRYEK